MWIDYPQMDDTTPPTCYIGASVSMETPESYQTCWLLNGNQ